ncbi:MAG TPA: S16 family serine protease, partial [Longimicrobiaceae bacterium]|nr:S16 family serine protease [Longimicrobiaceae bacterium]
IDIAGYTDEEKHEIARRYLLPRQLEENGLDEVQCRWTDGALRTVVEDYTREAGVRNLEREIGSVCRWVAARVASSEIEAIEITPERVAEALGAPKFVREDKLHVPQPGVVNGLAYTPVGGEVLHIEAVRFPGKGHTKLTGQLGEVMKESVSIAHSLVRARAGDLGIAPGDFDSFDVHVHVPAGAIPKDGPSAGAAMFTAIASLFTGKNVRADVAMTGEVTLRGLVLPIGGLKQKLLAASRLGIRTVLIPKLNEKDIPEIPETIRKGLEIVPVEHVDDVLRHALEA